MATLAQLRFRVNQKLGLDDTASGDEETLVTAYLNEAVTEVLLETHCFLAVAPASLTADEPDYEIDQDILAVHQIIGDGSVPWVQVTEQEIYDLRRASAASSIPTRFAISGLNMLMVWPTPTTAAAIDIYHVPKPTPMTSGSHDPSSTTYGGIPSEYHKALEFYALWQAADYDDDATAAQGDRYFGQYQAWLSKIRRGRRQKGGLKMPTLRSRRRRWVAHDPSQDVWR